MYIRYDKKFYIKKPVINANNTTTSIYIKKTLWINAVLFSSLEKIWRYILGIFNQLQQLEIVKNIIQ